MPDRYGFDELGPASVRCIDCPAGGPTYEWPEKQRARHARTHGRDRKEAAETSQRQLAEITGLADEQQELQV